MLTTRNFENKDLFGGRYQAKLVPYEGLDFSRRCFIFPGQGSAFAGMFKEELAASEIFRERINEADALSARLGIPEVSRYLAGESALSVAEAASVRNPALFSAEVAIAELLIAQGVRPALLTGHSFGEYAALAVAKVGSFADLFELVVQRDRLSPPPHSLGAMIVVNSPAEKIAQALAGLPHYESNLNGLSQTVISVRPEHLNRALAALKVARCPAKFLNEVPQPYHTPLMADTAAALAGYIAERNFRFAAPAIPVLSSVSGALLTAENFDPAGVAALLSEQLVKPVYFTRQIQAVIRQGILNFTETGPGETCAKFVIDILGESVFKVSPLKKYLAGNGRPGRGERVAKVQKENSGLLRALSKVISSVTGYSVDEISVHDNFQEDLGIDSIRKAEIVFKFMETMRDPSRSDISDEVNLSQIKRIEDVIEHFNRDEGPADQWSERRPPAFERYEEIWEARPLNSFDLLKRADQPLRKQTTLSLADPGQAERLADCPADSTLVLLAPRLGSASPESDLAHFRHHIFPWLAAFRTIAARPEPWNIQIALVSEPESDPYLKAFVGFFKCWVRERGFDAFKHVEVPEISAARNLTSLIEDEFLDHVSVDIRFRNQRREVKRWRLRPNAGPSALGAAPVVVSIGGARGIGGAVLKELLARHPRAHLYVLGRRPASDDKVRSSVEALGAGGRHVRYLQADAAVPSELESALRFVAAEHGPIDVVINGAGQEISRSFANKEESEIWAEYASKVAPANSLARAARSVEIRHLVNYSSMAAEFGNTGQSIYALGNQVMTGLASAPPMKVTNLILPPWDRLGMTENEIIRKSLLARGIALLEPEHGSRLVVDAIERPGAPAVAFLDTNDIRAYDCELTSRRAHEGFFSHAISTGRRLQIPRLNLKDFAFLQDHVINGNHIFPGSGALAMFFYVASQYFKEAPTIENFAVKSFLGVVAEQPPCFIELARREGGGDRLHLRIASKIVHFQAEAVVGNRELKVHPTEFTPLHEVEADPLYDNHLVVLGPSYRLTGGLWFDENLEFAQLSVNSKLPRHTPWIAFDRLHQWFEAALQTLGVVILHRSHRFWVPSKIRAVRARFENPVTDEIYYRVYVEEIGEETARGNVHIVNKYGQILFEIEGVEDMVVGPDPRTVAERFRYSPNPPPRSLWSPLPA